MLGRSGDRVERVADHGNEFIGPVQEQLVADHQRRDPEPGCDVPAAPVLLEARPVHVEARPVGLYAEPAVDHHQHARVELGREAARRDDLFAHPRDQYTQSLLNAVPDLREQDYPGSWGSAPLLASIEGAQ